MHDKIERPDYVDVEIEHADLRDIRYRLNVLDHKLDTVLSVLEAQDKVIRQSDERWVSALSIMKDITTFMQLINEYMQFIHGQSTNTRETLDLILALVRVRVLIDSPGNRDPTILERIEELMDGDES